MSQLRRLSSQRGTSLLGMVVIAVVIACIVMLAMQVVPAVNEYLTIRKTVARIMKDSPSSANDIRSAFDKTIQVEYSIKSIGPKDLVVTPLGDGFKTSYAYSVEIPLVEPAFLLLKFQGSASSGGSKAP